MSTDGETGDPMNGTMERLAASDWDAVRRIFQEGIDTGIASLETEPPTWEDWDRAHTETCRLVYREAGSVVGWAALSPVSERCVYGGVAEVSVYVAREAWGRGVGKALLGRLIRESEEEGIWTLQAGIFPENKPSIGLHEACGFRVVGVRERLGRLRDQWHDVVLMERRSHTVGT